MIINLNKGITRDQLARERIREKLSKKTVKQLREFARTHHISLAGESSKRGIVSEIMSQYGHVWNLKEDEIE